MDTQLKKGLIEYYILANLNYGDSYGYEIVKTVSSHLPITESTLYPILKRLETQGKVITYSKEHNGRLRKYYQIQPNGLESIRGFLESWEKVEAIHNYIKRSVEDE
ncbi:PadR family transcriptional regulator [Marinilactibacillus sp. 15R]|uniref:PadR family transcriptional regulator n=1 Tax=Marinilactibacillus sp. 15R TaxID=1911586 RepID=UPI00090A3ED8|nr:PadR family transcriptional regulator [Marinilactibacillus sp. 15R]API88696.1 PadR family transcriptional regulator [Marinilactibacillus sp. 15R]